MEQVRRLVANGYAEVVLSGVDITSWGADLPGQPKLGHLVRRRLKPFPISSACASHRSIRSKRTKNCWICSREERLMPHMHLSLQSGDDMILKRMKRRHSREDSIAFCQGLAPAPDIVFGADIIAGFPTETEKMFENSLKIADDCGLTYLHVFPFSPRPEPRPRACLNSIRQLSRSAPNAALKGRERLQAFLAAEIGATRHVLVETRRAVPSIRAAKFMRK